MSGSAGGGRARATRTAHDRARGADAGIAPRRRRGGHSLGNLASSFRGPRAFAALAVYAIARRAALPLLVAAAAAIAWELVTSMWPALLPAVRP